MQIYVFILLIIIIISLISLYFTYIYNEYQMNIIRINEAEASIDECLRNKFDLLNRSINIIKANLDIQEEILEDIVKLRSRKLSNFDLDRRLVNSANEFYEIKEKYPDLMKSETFVDICIDLSIIEEKLNSTKTYFNNIITKYNKLVRTFPSNIIKMIFKYKEKAFFDTKNMFDDDIEDFKL